MDAEAYFRREAAALLAEYPALTPEQIAREVQKDGYDGDAEMTATVLAVAAEMKARGDSLPAGES